MSPVVDTPPTAPPTDGPPLRDKVPAAAAVGLAVAACTAALVALSPVAWPGAVAALALIVLAPTAERLDRRLALNLALVVGWLPAVTYLPPLAGPQTAAAVALGLAAGATVTAAMVGRPVLPRTARRDIAIGAAGLLAALVALPLALAGTPSRALAVLSTGIDNSYHYAMFLEQRLSAAGSGPLAGQVDGSGFAFAHYPQWFHRGLTVLAQLVFGEPGAAASELVRYAVVQWLTFVVVAVLVTAALAQALPQRLRPTLAVPVVAVAWSLLLGVPGALNLIQGHLSFFEAACAPAVMFLLAVGVRRPGAGTAAALLGLLLVTTGWLLLLPLAGVALIPTLVGWWRRQAPVVRWTSAAVAAIGAVAIFVVVLLPWVTGAGLDAVTRDGTIPQVAAWSMFAILVGTVALLLGWSRVGAPGLWGHVVVTVVSALQMIVLGAYLLATTGELTYYFWKLGLGSLLVTLLVAAHAMARKRSALRPSGPRTAVLAAGVAVLAAALGLGSLLQNFRAPSAVWAGLTPLSLSALATSGHAGDVDLVLRLAASTPPGEAVHVRLIATRDDDMNAAHASEWFHALSHSSTTAAVSVDDPVYELAENPRDTALAIAMARSTLSRPGGVVVATDPALRQAITDAVGAGDAARVRAP